MQREKKKKRKKLVELVISVVHDWKPVSCQFSPLHTQELSLILQIFYPGQDMIGENPVSVWLKALFYQ